MKCRCTSPHEPRWIVLTGGPGAGKTAVLEVLRVMMCPHVAVLPEAAGLIFRGGFPRGPEQAKRRAAQRTIFHVQRELETIAEESNMAVVMCDRGTVDGVAYWPGPGKLFDAVGTTLERELARYYAVIHLRTPAPNGGYNHDNPLRIESAAEAAAIDARIAEAWATHPRRFEVPATDDFFDKVTRTLAIVDAHVPPCCRRPAVEQMLGRILSAERSDVAP
jgi:predicted ATPase